MGDFRDELGLGEREREFCDPGFPYLLSLDVITQCERVKKGDAKGEGVSLFSFLKFGFLFCCRTPIKGGGALKQLCVPSHLIRIGAPVCKCENELYPNLHAYLLIVNSPN